MVLGFAFAAGAGVNDTTGTAAMPSTSVLATRARTEPASQIRQELVRCTPLLAQPQQSLQKLVRSIPPRRKCYKQQEMV